MRRLLIAALTAAATALAACSDESAAPGRGTASPPGVLLLTVDTMRADHVGCMGHPGGLTPALDRIARRGLLARQAFTPAPITAVAHASILSGLEPPRHGVRDNTAYVLPDSVATLAEWLGRAGYRTGACIAAVPLDSRYGFARGFEYYDEDLEPTGDARGHFPERPADQVVDSALEWIQSVSADERWFLWTHLFDPHHPRRVSPPLDQLAASDDYEREIRFTDLQVRRLLRGLREHGGGSPWIAVLSDHGEGFGDHGEDTHGLFLFRETLRAFFAIAPPENGDDGSRLPRGVIDGVVRAADLPLTLLDALGLDPPDGLDGRSLLDDASGDGAGGAYGEAYYAALHFRWSPLLSWRDERWTYVEGPRRELYDRWSDPAEEHDVAAEHPDLVQRFSAEIAAMARDPGLPSAPGPDAATEEKLRALGYVATAGTGTPATWDASKDPRKLVSAANDIFEGTLLMIAGKPYSARSRFQSAYELDPENPSVLFLLADCHRDLGDGRTAMEYYRRTIAADPRVSTAYAHLAVLEFERGRKDEAMALLEESLALDPISFPALMTAGELSEDLQRPTDAADYYRRAAESDGRRVEPLVKLATLAEARGDAAGARKLWDEALAIKRDHPFIPDHIRNGSR